MKSACLKKQEVEVQEMVDIAKLRLIVEILPLIVSHQPVEANGGKLKYMSSTMVKIVKMMTNSYYRKTSNKACPLIRTTIIVKFKDKKGQFLIEPTFSSLK